MRGIRAIFGSVAAVLALFSVLGCQVKAGELAPSKTDYLNAFPAESLVCLQLRNIKGTLDKANGTAFGKLLSSAPLQPFRAKLEAVLNSPEAGPGAKRWAQRFQGQIAAALWELKPLFPQATKAGAILEITDADPDSVYQELLKLAQEPGVQTAEYNKVTITAGPKAGAFAHVGKDLIIGFNKDSVQKLIDGLLAPAGIGSSAAYQNAKPELGADPDLVMVFNIPAYGKMLEAMMPGLDSSEKASRANELQLLAIASNVKGEGFEERYVGSFKEVSGGAALSGATEPVMTAALLPANALAAAVGCLDGARLSLAATAGLDRYKKLAERFNGMQGEPSSSKVDLLLLGLEAQGVSYKDFLKCFNGEAGLWAVLPAPVVAAPPEAGMLLTCVDAEKAKSAAAMLSKLASVLAQKQAVKELPYKTNVICQLDLDALVRPGEAKPPVSPCWSAVGNRLLISSTVLGLQKELNNFESRTPGLLTQPEFVKALGMLTAAERSGQIGYVDMKALLTVAATVGLPVLQASMPDPDLQAALAALPQPAEMLKDFSPLVTSGYVKGTQSVMVIRSPFPPLLTVIGLSAGAAGFQGMKSAKPDKMKSGQW